MNPNEENEPTLRLPPTDDGVDSELKVAPNSHENLRRPELPSRPRTGMGAWQPPADPLPPLWGSSGSMNRNVPTHPSWEKPPSPFIYPRLRGQEKRQSMKPFFFVATGVALILGFVMVLPALTGRNGTTAIATASSSPSAIVSNGPVQSAAPSQSGSSGTPVPLASYQQYKVLAGDTTSKIAAKFHLQRWEFLLANPQITGPAFAVRLNTFVNIPVPGTLTQPPATPTGSPTPSSAATLLAP